MVTSGVLWGAGDILAQRIDGAADDWKRTAIQTFYASFVWAPFSHHWYKLLNRIALDVQRTAASPSRPLFLATKLALEIVALHPVSLLAFFGVVGIVNGESMNDINNQLRRDFLPTLALEIAMWTPLDTLIFAMVPVRHQLLAVNCGCFFESVGLSFIKKHGIFGKGGSSREYPDGTTAT